jgi:arylsulfatase A-like enzyme
VLDAVDRDGHADDTLVVFNSDHGFLLGKHGRFEKHCCFEESVGVALLMRLPGVMEPVVERAHELRVDLSHTFHLHPA